MKVDISAILLLSSLTLSLSKSLDLKKNTDKNVDEIDNDIIDFDDEYSVKYDKRYDVIPWKLSDFNKDSYKYTLVKDDKKVENKKNEKKGNTQITFENTNNLVTEKTTELTVIPLELLSTTETVSVSVTQTTPEPDLTVIPLSTTEKNSVQFIINQTITLPPSTEMSDDFNYTTIFYEMTTKIINTTESSTENNVTDTTTNNKYADEAVTEDPAFTFLTQEDSKVPNVLEKNMTSEISNSTTITSKVHDTISRTDIDSRELKDEVPIFTELDVEDLTEVPEDYYDSKDVIPTSAPKTDALSVIFGFAGSVVESVVESVATRVVPKSLIDLFKRMQRQSELLEAEKLRSREENGGIGQFTRGVIKSISTGLSRPFSQIMSGVRDIGSLDSDRGFVNSLASGVTTVANSMVDVFKDRVQAIYPGTIWCGDGHSAQARSSDLGLFFFTDTCCRQHDACKMYISAGETKFGLTNTGLFTRSHCSCDAKFRECLRKTNSLVSAQIGLTYFNVLGPQCFRKAHPIVKCVRRTRITSLKCEEYELDYTKPKMWQWFDNETY